MEVIQMRSLNITICGGGNGAHACAALLSLKGHNINIFSPIAKEAEIINANYARNGGLDATIEGRRITGIQINSISCDPIVIRDASIIFVIVPAYAHKTLFKYISKNMNPNALIVVLPSRGLIELDLQTFLPNKNVIAFQTLPWACRLVELGSDIEIKGIKTGIQASSRPFDLSELYYIQMEQLLDMPIERVKNMLTLTLANIGQIFHPGIMYGLFMQDPKRLYKSSECPLFYQGVTFEIAEILQLLADEIYSIAKKIAEVNPNIELDIILSPKEWLIKSYKGQIRDLSSLQAMLNSNTAYQGINAPMIKVDDNHYQANFNVRYVTEDIPYSLLVTKSLGDMMDIKTPTMDKVISELGSWIGIDYLEYYNTAKKLSSLSRLPLFYGIDSIQDL